MAREATVHDLVRDLERRRKEAAGVAVGTEILVNTTTSNSQIYPEITALSNGGFVVTWADRSGADGDTGWGIRARIYSVATDTPAMTTNQSYNFGGSLAGTTFTADAGNDTLYGSWFNDTLRGAEGHDSMVAAGGNDDINGNQGNDTLHGNDGDDWVVGGKDNDLLFGDTGNDIVYGNLGNDTALGGDGTDTVRGGQGDDSVSGGAGDDWLWGDRGNDTISGGTGADSFHTFTGVGLDRITDFNRADGDRLILDGSPAYTVSQVGADTVVDLGHGDQVVLMGVTFTSLSAGWIVGG